MKKLIGLAIFAAAFILPGTVHAAANFTITCAPTTVTPNGIVSCELKATSADEAIKNVSVNIKTTKPGMSFMDVPYVNNGWVNNSNGSALKFTYTGEGSISGSASIATFNLKIASNATECGDVCWSGLTYNDGTSGSTDGCITIALEGGSQGSTSDEIDNPDTGSFVPYLVIGGAAILAIGAIVVASRKNKFYNI